MTAEIITVGDEILIGQIVDTNSAWIGRHLNEIGVRLVHIASVADDAEAIKRSIDDAFSRADIVLMTGGLGPTKDDITKHTLADYFDMSLVRHQPTYEAVRLMTERRGFGFNELNQRQADVPSGCTVIPNHNGSAPAMLFHREGNILISMPGVPFEMEAIMTDSVIPYVKTHFDLHSVVHKTLITFGIAESILAETIAPWESALPGYLKLAYLPNANCIRLRLSAYDVDGAVATAEIEQQFAELYRIIPAYILGFEPVTLESATAEQLIAAGATLSVAESCTGGAIASRFTAMAGASAYFLGGVVAYSNGVKAEVLGVDRSDLESYGAVSEQVVEQMARGVRRLTGSDYSIATSGIAGPDGGTPEKPVGTVWIAVDTPAGTISRKMTFGNLRDENIKRAASHAINMLRIKLTQ